MKSVPSTLPDCFLIQPQVFADERGFFLESYNEQKLADLGIQHHFVQDNHSRSTRNVLRGIHYQIKQAQGKLVRVVSGEVFDVAVDLRRSSPTFGKWLGVRLSAENKLMFWVPPGFGHAFLVVSEVADFLYKATELYAPQYDRTIVWNDPDLSIEWPFDGQPIVSEKDQKGSAFRLAETFE
jgi:dTDP-4-dehydrorhamnose 3,5-epimerase